MYLNANNYWYRIAMNNKFTESQDFSCDILDNYEGYLESWSQYQLGGVFKKYNDEDPDSLISYLDNEFIPEVHLQEKEIMPLTTIIIPQEAKTCVPEYTGELFTPITCWEPNSPSASAPLLLNCSEDNKQATKEMTVECRNNFKTKVNLKYKGQKNGLHKGALSERKDVVYKTLMRGLRRYLWEDFVHVECVGLTITKISSKDYKDLITKFYNRHFRAYQDSSDEVYISLLSKFITNSLNLPNKTNNSMALSNLFKEVFKNFSLSVYSRFFSTKNVPEFFSLLIRSGVVDHVIQLYPKMRDSAETYKKAAETLANYSQTQIL